MPESWWLKFKRAQKHMVDIRAEARRYTKRDPYEFVRVMPPKTQQEVLYRVRITHQPDPVLGLILGDFVHNLRSALDHVIVACVPKQKRSSANFPIRFEDIYAKDPNGEFVVKDDGSRERFERAIDGLDPSARAFVIAAQPYWQGAEAHKWMPGIITRLDNADKHRALTTFGSGVRNISAEVTARGVTVKRTLGLQGNQFGEDGTVVGWKLPIAGLPDNIIPSEVDVKFSATPVVHVKITGVKGNEAPGDYPLRITLVMALDSVRFTLRYLEQFKLPS